MESASEEDLDLSSPFIPLQRGKLNSIFSHSAKRKKLEKCECASKYRGTKSKKANYFRNSLFLVGNDGFEPPTLCL